MYDERMKLKFKLKLEEEHHGNQQNFIKELERQITEM
jgi:hypothetical protein